MPCALTAAQVSGSMRYMAYVQRKFYLPEEMYRELTWRAQQRRVSITELLRRLVEIGLRETRPKNGAEALLELAHIAEKEDWSGPKDLSTHHDKYFVQAYEKLKEGKRRR